MMTNEEYLLRLVKGTADGLSVYVNDIDLSGSRKEKDFKEGEVCAMGYALQSIQRAVRLYEAKRAETANS